MQTNDVLGAGVAAGAALFMSAALEASLIPVTVHHFECFDADGRLKWEETVTNLTTNAGLNDMLSRYWKGNAYTAAFYVGLKGGGTIAASDTQASHAGWAEVGAYSNGARQALVLGAVAAQSVDNSASKASFNINATATVTGAFVTTDATLNGTAGTLVGASDFAASRTVQSGDVLNVTVTATAATA
ncbi:hypothetical protein [Methylobacterium sp. A54F]